MATDPLQIAEILRITLQRFSNSELLKLSLVNKQWNFEARSVLKYRGDLTARLSSVNPCQSLVAFASDLQQMRVVPFSGIHVELFHSKVCRSSLSKRALDPLWNVILNALKCKHLSVSFRDSWVKCKNCPALNLVRKIVDGSRGVLSEISIDLDVDLKTEKFQKMFQDFSFPSMKIFRIKGSSHEKSVPAFIGALVSSAPNLDELNFNGGLFFKQYILKGSSAVLVPALKFRPLYERMCESLIGSVRADTMEILADKNHPFDVESLNTVVPMALQASRISLKNLYVDLLFTVPLICYGICFENVTKLEIWVHFPSHYFKLLKGFDFTRVFPKLDEIKVVNHRSVAFTPEGIRGFLQQWSAIYIKTLPDRAVNIKRLTLNESDWESTIPLWARIFPQVQTLSVNTGAGDLSPFPFTLLWEQFVNLEEFTVTTVLPSLSITANLDSVFCGIFPEEVAELMEKDEEYLRAVNIVPVMPAITCMRDLRSFKLDFTVPSASSRRRDMGTGPPFLFSKVTVLTSFARCPTLAFKFESI